MAESKELEDFVRSACISIEKGVAEGLEIKFPIEFEIAVLIKREKDGMFKLLIVNDSRNYAEQKVSRIKFSIPVAKIRMFTPCQGNGINRPAKRDNGMFSRKFKYELSVSINCIALP